MKNENPPGSDGPMATALKRYNGGRVLVFVVGAFAEMSGDVSRICGITAHDLARTHVSYYNDDSKRTKGMYRQRIQEAGGHTCTADLREGGETPRNHHTHTGSNKRGGVEVKGAARSNSAQRARNLARNLSLRTNKGTRANQQKEYKQLESTKYNKGRDLKL